MSSCRTSDVSSNIQKSHRGSTPSAHSIRHERSSSMVLSVSLASPPHPSVVTVLRRCTTDEIAVELSDDSVCLLVGQLHCSHLCAEQS